MGELRSRPAAGLVVSVTDLSSQATRLQLELEGLVHPEICVSRNVKAMPETLETQQQKLSELSALIQQMEQALPNERNKLFWQQKIKQHKLKYTMFEHKHREQKLQHDKRVREQSESHALLGRSAGEGIVNMINSAGKEHESLQRSTKMTDTAIDIASAALGALKTQGTDLKRARSKVVEIGQSLGLSNSLLRVINRREWGDSIIVYSGMVITVVILYFVWRLVQ